MNMLRASVVLSAITLSLVLAGCSDATKKEFGLEANPPDAFQVGTQPPLSLPPELGQLQAPNPGQPPTQEQDAAQAGANVISPQNAIAAAPSGGATPGEQAFLQAAGPTPPEDIRAAVNQNALIANKPPGFVSQLMGSGPAAQPTVNASAEQQRLQENEALGQPLTNGSTPQTSNESPGLLQRFLNLF